MEHTHVEISDPVNRIDTGEIRLPEIQRRVRLEADPGRPPDRLALPRLPLRLDAAVAAHGQSPRGVEALELVKANPGITIPEIAEKMGIKQNYLYRVLPGLAQDGLVIKDGRGWKPRERA